MTDASDGSVEVSIHGLGSEGAGVGRLPDGRAVFVHRTAPGDRVRIRVTEEHPRWARGTLVSVVEEGPGRRVPPCPHYRDCGGCTLEHLEYPTQLRWKGRLVADALERIGGHAAEPPPVEASPRELSYRNRVTFTLRRTGGGGVVAGFHTLDDPGTIVDVDARCLLPEESLARGWQELREAWGPGAELLPDGETLRLTLRNTDEGFVLVVDGGRGGGDAGALVDTVESLVGVWSDGDQGVTHLAGRQRITERWLDEEVELGPRTFLQVNREAGELLQRRVLDRVLAMEPRRVIDGYAGVAAYGRALARAGVEVVAVELDPRAVRTARDGAPDGLTVVEGAVEDRLEGLLPADVVVVNPPRAGLHPRVPEALLRRPPPALIYVSCDQATLARDTRRLASGYRVDEIQAFDLFPQTAHVEVMAIFRTLESEQ